MKENKIMVIRELCLIQRRKETQDNPSVLTKSHRLISPPRLMESIPLDYKIKTSYADLLHSLIFKSAVFLKFLLTLFFIFILIFWPHREKILVPGPGIELALCSGSTDS